MAGAGKNDFLSTEELLPESNYSISDKMAEGRKAQKGPIRRKQITKTRQSPFSGHEPFWSP